eukprot:scaffold52641_cov48-Attheya_sp.AAC.5
MSHGRDVLQLRCRVFTFLGVPYGAYVVPRMSTEICTIQVMIDSRLIQDSFKIRNTSDATLDLLIENCFITTKNENWKGNFTDAGEEFFV